MKAQRLALAVTVLLVTGCAPAGTGGPPLSSGDGLNQCKADQYQRYIGRNRSELPTRPADEMWRVTCTTCPVTMDYSPRRLNILYDETTGVIREVKCG